MSKQMVIKEKHYVGAWANICSIFMFFIAFFTAFFVVGHELSSSFVKSVFVLVVTNIIAKGLVLLWQVAIPKEQWLLMVHGAPAIDSRSMKRQALIDALEKEEENGFINGE